MGSACNFHYQEQASITRYRDIDTDGTYRTSATEHAEVIGDFMGKMATWLSVFAQSLVKHWRSTGYKKARQTSGHDAERTYRDMVGASAGDGVVDEHL